MNRWLKYPFQGAFDIVLLWCQRHILVVEFVDPLTFGTSASFALRRAAAKAAFFTGSVEFPAVYSNNLNAVANEYARILTSDSGKNLLWIIDEIV